MDITRFYQDLLTFRKYHKDQPLTLAEVIHIVEEELEEIRQDHVQGDVDDQERNG